MLRRLGPLLLLRATHTFVPHTWRRPSSLVITRPFARGGTADADPNKLQRLFVDAPLMQGITHQLGEDQSNYLAKVLRLRQGAQCRVFNGRDGEFVATISSLGSETKRRRPLVTLSLDEPCIRTQPVSSNDVRLLFAAIKVYLFLARFTVFSVDVV